MIYLGLTIKKINHACECVSVNTIGIAELACSIQKLMPSGNICAEKILQSLGSILLVYFIPKKSKIININSYLITVYPKRG